MNVQATPKFFKRKLPNQETMELLAQSSALGYQVFIFLRENDDSDSPSRIRIVLSEQQARDFAAGLIGSADSLRSRVAKEKEAQHA